ncbi:winged helix-turn-helix domain-containing protein [Streptomyces sp. NBC_00057]|uniref:winged helix-turn-helix domain-containing protein n=1 Tax=Streptomyces sp. NBC_00057 TaxID=2975634 RepID=UPI0032502525
MNAGPPQPQRPVLDETLHVPSRLAIVAFLSACAEAEFAAVRDHCHVSDSVLSKAASALEAAGYVEIRKGYVGKRPRTWLSLTPAGQLSLAQHVAALQDIVSAAQNAGASAQALGGADPDLRPADGPGRGARGEMRPG